MEHNMQKFTPEQVDTQIDELFASPPSAGPNKRLVDELQQMYRDDERSLLNVWQRLLQDPQADYREGTSAVASRPAVEADQSAREGKMSGDEIAHLEDDLLECEVPGMLSPEVAQPPAHPKMLSLRRRHPMQQTSRRSLARTLSIAAAACVVVLLVGSLLWVTTLARLDKQTAAHPPAAQHTQSVLPTGIYMSSDQGVFRLDTRTHRVLWQRSLPHAAKIVPAGNVVYVLQSSQFGTSNAVAALDASSGKILWTHNIAQSSNKIGYATDLLFANGRLYVGWFASSTKSVTNGVLQGARTSGQIYVFDAANGRQRAVYAASAGVNSLVAADGLLVAGTDSELQTYNLADGTSQWHVPFTLGMHVLSMNIVEGRLYAVLSNNNDVAGEGQSSIVAYQLRGAQAGHQVWQSPKFPGDALYHFTVDRNIIYFGTFKSGAGAQSSFLTGKVYAYDLQSNHQLWSRPVNGGVQTAPVVSDGVVYVSADDGPDGHHALILALSATTGAVKWQQKLANDQADDFCVSNGVIYVIGMSYVSRGGVKPVPGTLYALNAADGSQLWQDRQQGTPNLVVPTA